jgi:pimeloyl-ACP methyl ester carboxylesterase
MRTDVILLPGLHGSTSLFDTFVALAPPWARCRPISLPLVGSQHFDALADVIEPQLRPLEGFVLFGESFSGPLAARLAARLGRKVSLLVLCNPLVESPVVLAPSVLSSIVRSPMVPTWAVSLALTGGDRRLAAAVRREVRALPVPVLVERLAVALACGREDLLRYLALRSSRS